jgi:YHS domain-containing protein
MEQAIDPVCQMTVEIATARFSTEYEGTTYYFCAPGCQRAFVDDPEAYLQKPET